MRWRSTTTKFVAACAVWCCCALPSHISLAQTPEGRGGGIAPTTIARSGANSVLVKPAQYSETLPEPLRFAPAEPELSPPDVVGSNVIDNSGAPLNWPADAPVQQHYGDRFEGPGFPGHGYHHSYGAREPWFHHDTPNDPARHTGWGNPLTGTSWLNRPWYVGTFVGGMLADDLLRGQVETDSAPIVGMRIGHDFDHFWGWEVRYAYSRVETFTGAGVPIAEPGREYFVDVALQHYPWGDSRWRPYLLAGIGFVNARYVDDLGQGIDDTALTIPLGFGLKLFQSPWFTVRFDAVDTISFSGSHLDTMHNVSLMLGCEYRFGGTRPSYFPWTGNTSYW
jgi:hypothetical protein